MLPYCLWQLSVAALLFYDSIIFIDLRDPISVIIPYSHTWPMARNCRLLERCRNTLSTVFLSILMKRMSLDLLGECSLGIDVYSTCDEHIQAVLLLKHLNSFLHIMLGKFWNIDVIKHWSPLSSNFSHQTKWAPKDNVSVQANTLNQWSLVSAPKVINLAWSSVLCAYLFTLILGIYSSIYSNVSADMCILYSFGV